MMFRFSSTRINCNKNDCTVTVELPVENLFVVSLDTGRGEELVIMCPLVFNIVFQYNPLPSALPLSYFCCLYPDSYSSGGHILYEQWRLQVLSNY